MRAKRLLSVGIFVAAILVAGGLIISTFGQSTSVVADETSASAAESDQASSVILASVEYPVNEYGLSYGDAMTVQSALAAIDNQKGEDELSYDDCLAVMPDLVAAKTNEGEDGYFLAEDYLSHVNPGLYINAHKDEILKDYDSLPDYTVATASTGNVITVYAADGMTELGHFGYSDDEAVIEVHKYESEWEIYTVTTYTYPDGSGSETVCMQTKDGAPGVPISDIEAGLWPLSSDQIKELPEITE